VFLTEELKKLKYDIERGNFEVHEPTGISFADLSQMKIEIEEEPITTNYIEREDDLYFQKV